MFYHNEIRILLAAPQGLWDLSAPTRDGTRVHGSESPSLNHWTAREFPIKNILHKKYIYIGKSRLNIIKMISQANKKHLQLTLGTKYTYINILLNVCIRSNLRIKAQISKCILNV